MSDVKTYTDYRVAVQYLWYSRVSLSNVLQGRFSSHS